MTVRVLIVEDNPINRELIDYLLRAHGFETLKALDGAIGLDMARRERPDLILCDIQMPVMDGVEFAHHVKSDPALRATPLIALTALAMVGDRERILAEGFDGFITKPLDPATMVESLNAFLHLPSREATAPPVAASPGAATSNHTRILVLDDTPYNLELKRDLLEPHGYQVATAASADEAWALAQQQVPDLILSDVGMQTGSGFDFIRRVKADERLRDVPFIFLSSTHWDSASMEAGLRLGAARYLLRPLDPERLLEEITSCLRQQPAR
jgi:two-component system, cell cycle response regulator